MKKLKIFLLTLVILFISGCVNKIPFKAKEPFNETSLVYIYISSDFTNDSIGSSKYKIHINSKKVDATLQDNEYISFNLIPEQTTMSVTRTQIEEQSIKLKLQAGKTYYLRVKSDLDNGGFEFEEVQRSVGMQEITRTGLSGSSIEEEDMKITEIVEPKLVSTKQELSKTDEIKKAHKLKEAGIISEEEFKALKAEILAK